MEPYDYYTVKAMDKLNLISSLLKNGQECMEANTDLHLTKLQIALVHIGTGMSNLSPKLLNRPIKRIMPCIADLQSTVIMIR